MAANAISKLQDIQRGIVAFGETRQTPFGVVVPKYAAPITAIGVVTVPAAYGTQIQVVDYQAKPGFYAIICGLVFQFQGAGPAPLPNDSSWRVDVDAPTLGTVGVSGYPMKDYGAIPILLGNFTTGWVWPCDFRFVDGQAIRIKATPVANMGLNVGNFFLGALLGYEWPKGSFEGGA